MPVVKDERGRPRPTTHCVRSWPSGTVELAALHAATKNMINSTARILAVRTRGRPVPSPPHTADVAFRVEVSDVIFPEKYFSGNFPENF